LGSQYEISDIEVETSRYYYALSDARRDLGIREGIREDES
jgi:hypothetical protein